MNSDETLDLYQYFSQRLGVLNVNTCNRVFSSNENRLAKCEETWNDLTQQFFSIVVSGDSELVKLKKSIRTNLCSLSRLESSQTKLTLIGIVR